MPGHITTQTRPVQVRAGAAFIDGDLVIPPARASVVSVSVSWWGNVRERREVLELADR